MGVVKKPTLAKMRLLHAVLVKFGPMCVSDAADTADLHKGSSQDWMVRLARLGCAYELPKESPVCVKKNARYYAATDVPFSEDEAVGLRGNERRGVMLVEFNKNAAYRAQTERMANSPRDTFVCACCGGYKSILGRKAMPSPGKRRIYKCKACHEAGK